MQKIVTKLGMLALFTVLFLTNIAVSTNSAAQIIQEQVNKSVKELNSSSLRIPRFETARADEVVRLNKRKDLYYYICWLKDSDDNQVGYFALCGRDSSYRIIAFSATANDPTYFLASLQMEMLQEKMLTLSKIEKTFFIEEDPLIAGASVNLGGEVKELSEKACTLSNVFLHLQKKEGMRLLGDLSLGGGYNKKYNPGYEALKLNNTDRKLLNENISARKKEMDWIPFKEEWRSALEKENINFDRKERDKIVASRARARRIFVPICRRRLLDPITPQERTELLAKELTAIGNTTLVKDCSSGMRVALLLQEDYLSSSNAGLKKDLAMFFKTRGLTAEIDILPYRKIPKENLPAIIFNTHNQFGLVLGYINIDGADFSIVFFPKTCSVVNMSLAERGRQIRKKLRIKEKVRKKPPSEEVQKALDRINALKEKTIIVVDMLSRLPDSLENGIHLISCDAMSKWEVMYISNINLSDNWGIYSLNEDENVSP